MFMPLEQTLLPLAKLNFTFVEKKTQGVNKNNKKVRRSM